MNARIYHGNITPDSLAQVLVAQFTRRNLRAQQLGNGDQVTVQIATPHFAQSGGNTAISVNIQKVEDGVSVSIGKQAWFGVAASLGMSALSALRNPFTLLGRLDDIAQDIENLQLTDDIWQTIDRAALAAGAGQQLSERLRRMICDFCNTANPVGEPRCIACGAPLGDVQPNTCTKCGFILNKKEKFCPNCGQPQ